MSSEINMIIDNLCQKFGTSAAFLIPELAKKEIAENIITIIITALFGKCMIEIIARIVKYAKEEEDSDFFVLIIFYGMGLAIDFFALAFSAADLAGWIASPTAKAIEQIASMIK